MRDGLQKKGRAAELSKCCLFGIYCLFGHFKSCLGHSSAVGAGPPCLSSLSTFALLCPAAEWAPSTQKSSVFRGEWLNDHQRNALESKGSLTGLDFFLVCFNLQHSAVLFIKRMLSLKKFYCKIDCIKHLFSKYAVK